MGQLRKSMNSKGRRFVFLSVLVIIILASCKPEEKNPELAVGYDDTSGQSPEFVFVSRGETVTNNINHYTLFNY